MTGSKLCTWMVACSAPLLLAVLTVPAQDSVLSDKEQLGKSIFFDENLSINQNQSCAACHAPQAGWTGPDTSINAHGGVYEGSIPGRFGDRKPPSSAYATQSPVFYQDKKGLFTGANFWDGRANNIFNGVNPFGPADPNAWVFVDNGAGLTPVIVRLENASLASQAALAVAKRQGRLHRNFQGYSTQPDCDLIGLGVSSIGRVGATYSQHAKTLPEYYDAVNHGHFPVVRGLALTREDLLRRAVIMALMCQGRLEFESIELAHLIDVRRHFAAELEQLRSLEESGLVVIEPSAIQVTALGWYFIRSVAMVFDKHLQADRTRERFSRII